MAAKSSESENKGNQNKCYGIRAVPMKSGRGEVAW